MVDDVQLFWLALAGFWLFDNLVLVPKGHDYLKFGMSGRLRYEPGARLQARSRDLVFLNPLDPFDRLILTAQIAGPVPPLQFRASQRVLRAGLAHVNRLSWAGSCYLLVVVLLASASPWLDFGHVLLGLALAHAATWATTLAILILGRQSLHLAPHQIFSLAAEAVLVPGHVVNMAKRVGRKHTLPVPGLSLGLRSLRRMKDNPQRELFTQQFVRRLEDVALDMGLDFPAIEATSSDGGESSEALRAPPGQAPDAATGGGNFRAPESDLHAWFQEARKCLTTSVKSVGR